MAIIGAGPVASAIASRLDPSIAQVDGREADLLILTVGEPESAVAHAASGDAVILVATDAVERVTAATIAMGRSRDVPAGRILGVGTVPETIELTAALAERVSVDPNDVHIDVVGEHGSQALPLWSTARVGGTPLPMFRPRDKRPLTVPERSSLLHASRQRAATDEARTAATDRVVRAILEDRCAVLNVCTVHASFGSSEHPPACFGAPAIVGRAGVVRVVDETPMNPAESAGLVQTAERLHAEQHEGI